jgi:hypothetical protein
MPIIAAYSDVTLFQLHFPCPNPVIPTMYQIKLGHQSFASVTKTVAFNSPLTLNQLGISCVNVSCCDRWMVSPWSRQSHRVPGTDNMPIVLSVRCRPDRTMAEPGQLTQTEKLRHQGRKLWPGNDLLHREKWWTWWGELQPTVDKLSTPGLKHRSVCIEDWQRSLMALISQREISQLWSEWLRSLHWYREFPPRDVCLRNGRVLPMYWQCAEHERMSSIGLLPSSHPFTPSLITQHTIYRQIPSSWSSLPWHRCWFIVNYPIHLAQITAAFYWHLINLSVSQRRHCAPLVRPINLFVCPPRVRGPYTVAGRSCALGGTPGNCYSPANSHRTCGHFFKTSWRHIESNQS